MRPMTPRDALLARITAWSQRHPDIRGALLVGSMARRETPADEHSDLDVVLFVDDPRPWVEDASWVAELGEPWVTFVEPTPVGHGMERRVLYADGADVDFSLFAPPDSAAGPGVELAHVHGVLQRGARRLADPEGFLATMLAAADAAEPVARVDRPSPRELENVVGDVLYHLVWAGRKALRGERWVAAECINGHVGGRLMRLTAWHAAAVGGATDTWHGGRFVERWGDPRAVELLGRAMADTALPRIGAALRAAAAAVELLGSELAAASGGTWPAEAHHRVVAWLDDRLR